MKELIFIQVNDELIPCESREEARKLCEQLPGSRILLYLEVKNKFVEFDITHRR